MRVAVTMEQCWHEVPGGTARAAIETALAVDALDHVEQLGVAARHRRPPAEPWQPPIPVAQLPLWRPLLYESWHRLGWPPVEQATGPVEVIHATGFAIPPATSPLVVTVHDLAFLHSTRLHTRRGSRFLRRSVELARRRADLVICPSQATFDDCVAHGFEADRLRIVPWGVHQEPARTGEVERVRRAHALPERFVLFVGTLEPRKNLVRLLEAFRAVAARPGCEEVRLVLAGPGGWGDDLGERIEALGERVQRVGFVAAGDLPALYAAATVLCYPSLLEGFGLPVLEAMVQATPVVTSSPTATGELIATGGGVAVDPTSSGEIAAALAMLLEDPELAARMGEAARQAAARYTWERTAELTVAAYRELA